VFKAEHNCFCSLRWCSLLQ